MTTHARRRAPARTPHRFLLAALCLLSPLAGCEAPPATMELIAVARTGLAGAGEAEDQRHEQEQAHLAAQAAALDAAFDADVRLAAAGELTGADGERVALDAEWVISARKGYAAARDLLADEARAAEREHATRADNLRASDEALEMAQELIAERWAVGARVRRTVMNLFRSTNDE